MRLTLCICLLIHGCVPGPKEGPELILTGGRIRLGDLGAPVGAIAIDGDRIAAAGGDAEIRALAAEHTQVMDLEDAAVLPGFTDAWLDLEQLGRWPSGLDVSQAATPREVQAKLREAAAGTAGPLVGWGWDETLWPTSELPDHRVLDEAIADRPVLLYRRTGDVGWVNERALQEAGIDTADDAPRGLLRGASGAPRGIVAGEALRRVETIAPRSSRQQRRRWLEAGMRSAVAAGITTVATPPLDAEALEILERMERDGDVPLRVRVRLPPGVEPPARPADALVQPDAVAIVVDGPFRPPLAALEQPYAGSPERGNLWLEPAEVTAACDWAGRVGLPLDVRVQGDRAIRVSLEACAPLAEGHGLLVGGDLLVAGGAARVAGVPGRMLHDLYWLEARLGARAAAAHRYRSLLAAGQLTAIASQAPEYELDPMGLVRAMSVRRDPDGYPLDGWGPAERISRRDGLRIATAPLRALARPTAGAGDLADLVIWSGDPLDDSQSLPALRALMTLLGGRVVYSRPLIAPSAGSR